MDKQERINQLLSQKRMSDGTGEAGNQLAGLRDLIVKYVKGDFKIAEIGSYEGASSEMFVLNCQWLYCIDPYATGGDFSQETKDQLDRAESVFINRMLDYTNYSKIKDKSFTASDQFEPGSLDMVYIDGMHTYDAVVSDINRWLPKVKNGGYIAGHDCYGEVKQAVNDTLGEVAEVFDDGSWIIHKVNLPMTEYDPAAAYDKVFKMDVKYNEPLEDRDSYIDQYVNKTKGKLLDAGCGKGHNLIRITKSGRDIMGLEISQYCCDNYLKNVKCICTDIISYSKKNEGLDDKVKTAYDGIICTDVLEHIPLKQLDATLIALKKLGKSLLFGIANHSDLKLGFELHLIQKPLTFWEAKLREFWVDVQFIDIHNSMYFIFEVK